MAFQHAPLLQPPLPLLRGHRCPAATACSAATAEHRALESCPLRLQYFVDSKGELIGTASAAFGLPPPASRPSALRPSPSSNRLSSNLRLRRKTPSNVQPSTHRLSSLVPGIALRFTKRLRSGGGGTWGGGLRLLVRPRSDRPAEQQQWAAACPDVPFARYAHPTRYFPLSATSDFPTSCA